MNIEKAHKHLDHIEKGILELDSRLSNIREVAQMTLAQRDPSNDHLKLALQKVINILDGKG